VWLAAWRHDFGEVARDGSKASHDEVGVIRSGGEASDAKQM
jgi:hypothetical protein